METNFKMPKLTFTLIPKAIRVLQTPQVVVQPVQPVAAGQDRDELLYGCSRKRKASGDPVVHDVLQPAKKRTCVVIKRLPTTLTLDGLRPLVGVSTNVANKVPGLCRTPIEAPAVCGGFIKHPFSNLDKQVIKVQRSPLNEANICLPQAVQTTEPAKFCIGKTPLDEFLKVGFFEQIWTSDKSACRGYDFLNNYEIISRLGTGGFGSIFLASRFADGRKVAVKVVHDISWFPLEKPCEAIAESHPSVTSVPLEINLMVELRGVEGVIQLLDAYQSTSSGYILVLETFDGATDLRNYISSRGRLSDCEARHFFKQTVETLKRVYERGIYHMDIKHSNVLVDRAKRTSLLIDFGAARRVKKGAYKTFTGTLWYCPPECHSKQLFDGMKMTSWSLGMLLMIMITGCDPTVECTVDQLPKSYVLPECLSPTIQDLIMNCFHKDPAMRPDLKGILHTTWMQEGANYGYWSATEYLEPLSVKPSYRFKRHYP